MTLKIPLFSILFVFCFGYSYSQEVSLALHANTTAQGFKVLPNEIITKALLKHQKRVTLILTNNGHETIQWYSQQSYSWLYLSVTKGILKAGESIKLPLEMRVASLPQAIYNDTLYFKDSKSFKLLALVPVEVMIEARPKIKVPFNHFSPALLANEHKEITFTVENEGNTELDYNVYTDVSIPWLKAVLPTQGVIAPGEKREHTLMVDGSGIANGSYRGSAWISSNDPNQPRTFIEVDLTMSTAKAIFSLEVNKSGLCQDETFDIPYTFKGIVLGKANKIVAELSDAKGDFKNPVIIGEKRNQELNGTLPVHIPATLAPSDTYKIRLRSFDPPMNSIDQGNAFSVGETIELAFEPLPSVCDTEDDFLLTQASPVGGTYLGTGIVEGKFSPRLAGAGNHIIRYVYQTDQGCSREISQQILVRESPKISHFPVDPICQGTQAFSLKGGKPKGGYYEGAGIKSSGLLIPQNMRLGAHKLRYVVEQTACRSEVEVDINIVPSPEKPSFVQSGNHLIAEEGHVQYAWSLNGDIIAGATQRILSPQAYGSYILWIKNEAGCQTASDSLIFEAPDISDLIWQSLKISPTPAKDHFYISGEIKGSEHPSTLNMIFSDEKGRSMIEASYGNIKGRFTRRVNWSGLKPGVYQLTLEWEGKSYQQQVLIVDK